MILITNIERTIIEVLAVLALVGGFALYEQHRGAAKCIAADAAAVAKQEVHVAVKGELDAKTINDEARVFKNVLAEPAPIDVPHVRLCHYTPAALPRAAAPRPLPDAAPAGRSQDQGTPDLGPPLVKVGRDSDAQVIGLQDYVKNVCLVR
jgi:hypothetical protein